MGTVFFMPFTVYILYSKSIDQFYIGHSSALADRLYRHNHSGSKSTRKANDWILVYTETYQTRQEAVNRETEIKKRKSRKYIEGLVSSVG